MKKFLIVTLVLAVFGISTLVSMPAHANNRSVESALANYEDVSEFYAALLNTGVLGELQEGTHYTILAPTNEAFAQIRPHVYPCFYAVQCRAQLADVVRDHIIVGRWSPRDMVRQPQMATLGHYGVLTEQPFVGEYTVSGVRVLSSAEINGNRIDRINGVIMTGQQLDQFRALPPVANAVTEKTITTYRTPVSYPAPGGGYDQRTVTETVTQKTYADPAPGVVMYPDGTQVTTTRRDYITPEGVPAAVDQSTTTRVISP